VILEHENKNSFFENLHTIIKRRESQEFLGLLFLFCFL